ncbi:MAG: hypothetical protein R2778_16060 [Saprospiraceae bacterium]
MVLDFASRQAEACFCVWNIGHTYSEVCLIFAAQLIKIWWLKPLGGVYLIYLTWDYFRTKATPKKEDDILAKRTSGIIN